MDKINTDKGTILMYHYFQLIEAYWMSHIWLITGNQKKCLRLKKNLVRGSTTLLGMSLTETDWLCWWPNTSAKLSFIPSDNNSSSLEAVIPLSAHVYIQILWYKMLTRLWWEQLKELIFSSKLNCRHDEIIFNITQPVFLSSQGLS